MLAWAFPCENVDEVGALLRALSKHRYLLESEHRLHWAVDAALSDQAPFTAHARAFTERRKRERDLDPASYEPTLWRVAPIDDVIEALRRFWTPGPAARDAASRLRALVEHEGLTVPTREPFEGDTEYPDHPQLVQLSWRLLPIDQLDPERHAGALGALADSGEEVDVSAVIDQEGPDLGVLELTAGVGEGGELRSEFLVWADGSRGYNDYVFRGACKAARVPWGPEGPDDDEGDDEALNRGHTRGDGRRLTAKSTWIDCRPLERRLTIFPFVTPP